MQEGEAEIRTPVNQIIKQVRCNRYSETKRMVQTEVTGGRYEIGETTMNKGKRRTTMELLRSKD